MFTKIVLVYLFLAVMWLFSTDFRSDRGALVLTNNTGAQTGGEQGGPKVFDKLKSLTDDQVVITRANGDDFKFVRNSSTKLIGKVTTGTNVTVHYRQENNETVATVVAAARPE